MTAGPTCQPIYVIILLPPLLQASFACGDGGPTVAMRGDDNGAAVSLAEVGATTGQWWPCTATASQQWPRGGDNDGAAVSLAEAVEATQRAADGAAAS